MSPTKLFISALFLLPAAVHAEFEYIEMTTDIIVSINKQCPENHETISLIEGAITITPKTGSTYRLALDEFTESPKLILGRPSTSSSCTLAVKYADNDVNESYSVFVYSQKNKKFTPSKIQTITNPDFPKNRILSNYREAALLHNDALCFSEHLNDYFTCEKREQFDDNLEKIETCNEFSCSKSNIVQAGKNEPITGTIKADKIFFFDKTEKELFTQRKGYLINGDEISLHDYFQTRDTLYYNVKFSGKRTITGWIPSNSIEINNQNINNSIKD